MRRLRPPSTLLMIGFWLALFAAPPAAAQELQREYSALEAQEAAADILDTYERIFKRFDSSIVSPTILGQIDRARGQLFAAPPEELEVMGREMGADLVQIRQLARIQGHILLTPHRGGPFEGLSDASRALEAANAAAQGGFPSGLPLDPPDYPFLRESTPSGNVPEAELEDAETELEDEEDDIEDGSGINRAAQSLTCEKAVNSVTGRVNRRTSTEIFVEWGVVSVIRLADGIAHDFCGQEILGFNCSTCCVVSTIIRVIAEAFWEAVGLCEGAVDGAEIEAAYLNTRTIFQGLDHVHDDVEGIESTTDRVDSTTGQIRSTVNALGPQIAGVDSNLSSRISDTEGRLSSQLGDVEANILDLIVDSGGATDDLIEAFQARDIQLKIEANLLAGEDQAISMFQLPASAGGFLELARDIVDAAITNTVAAGENPGNARDFWFEGNRISQEGEYKQAYWLYSLAYKAVVEVYPRSGPGGGP